MQDVTSDLEKHFEGFRASIIGREAPFDTPHGRMKKLYADTTASGLPDARVESAIMRMKLDYANTHTQSNHTGETTTKRYHEAGKIIKGHVNAGPDDLLITAGSGMTEVLNKLARIMGVKEKAKNTTVFITHMEHHSNILPWRESEAMVITIPPDESGLPDVSALDDLCRRYASRKLIGSFIAASNVTGVRTPYKELAKIMHKHGGVCIVDFAACAPYDHIDMHPKETGADLDAIVFSPHKMQGGTEATGILVYNKNLRVHDKPDRPGGGTVDMVDPWGGHLYTQNLEDLEDGGTPAILGRIRAALAIKLKEEMGVDNITKREEELIKLFFNQLEKESGVKILESHNKNRVGIVAFNIEGVPYGLATRLLNDRFGIQVRGGCSCAGPYGHYLLNIKEENSRNFSEQLKRTCDASSKPGWVRVSLPPTLKNNEVARITDAIKEIRDKARQWREDYRQVAKSPEFEYVGSNTIQNSALEADFRLITT